MENNSCGFQFAFLVGKAFPNKYNLRERISSISTVELQWLEDLWNHDDMFETEVHAVRTNECYSLRQVRRHNRDIFSIFFHMEECCVFS